MDAISVDRPVDAAARYLAQTRAAVDPVLRSVIERTPSELRLVMAYHFGLCDRWGNPAGGGAGKAIRPALAMAGCELVGGHAAQAVAAAVAVELAHNFTLLHDDVMDGDRMRRNRPTVWAVFGVADAILAGDALQATAFQVLTDHGGEHVAASLNRLAVCMVELCEGQHYDCAFQDRPDVGVAECQSMAEMKTGALLGCSCALGALAAGADPRTVDLLDRWGRRMGQAFQLVDDLLGIWGDPAVTGKPAHSDLASGKKSMPVVAALASGTPAGTALHHLLAKSEPLTPADQIHAADLIEAAGARTWTRTRADALLHDADRLLAEIEESGAAGGSANIRALSELIVRRDY